MNGKVAREHRIYFNFSHKYKFDLSLVKFRHFSSLLSSVDSHKSKRGCANAEVGIAGSFCLFCDKEHLVFFNLTLLLLSFSLKLGHSTQNTSHTEQQKIRSQKEKKRNGNSRERKKKSYSTFFLFSSELFFLLLLSLFIHSKYVWRMKAHKTQQLHSL